MPEPCLSHAPYARLLKAKRYIESHFDMPVDIEATASRAYYSRFHFIRLFKQAYGATPHRYLTAVRIGKAKRLLNEGASVSDACFMVGFDSVSTFTALFKRAVGSTPAEFRRQRQALREGIDSEQLRYIPGCHRWVNM